MQRYCLGSLADTCPSGGAPLTDDLVLAGETLTERSYEVDYTNVLSQTWPLAAVPAGRLWGPADQCVACYLFLDSV